MGVLFPFGVGVASLVGIHSHGECQATLASWVGPEGVSGVRAARLLSWQDPPPPPHAHQRDIE